MTMNAPVNRLAAEEAWRAACGRIAEAGREAEPIWLVEARREACAAFAENGLPSPRAEDWRWSNIHRWLASPYPPLAGDADAGSAGAGDIGALLADNPFAGMEASLMVFVNGRLDGEHSSIVPQEGVEIGNLAGCSKAPAWLDGSFRADDAVDQLNMALAGDGLVVRVAAGVKAARPLVVVNVTEGDGHSVALRHVLRLEEGAELCLVEAHVGGGDHVANVVTRIDVGEGARLSRVNVNLKDERALQLANVEARVAGQGRFHDVALLMGGRYHRQQDFISFAGEGAAARADCAYLLRGAQHADTRLVVDHAAPHCTSRETFKCVMDEAARGAFQGLIRVAPGALKTDGQMAAHGLLLGETAEFDAKPELEIYADDVICAHGATTGALDEEQLFYLRARGIDERRARALLIAAFVGEVFDEVENEAAKAALAALAEGWLAGEAA